MANASDTSELSMYFTAILSGNVAMVKGLMLRRVSCFCLNNKGQYPIHLAAALGQLQILKLFVNYAPESVDVQDTLLRTPLIWASLKGHIQCVMYLLQNGANIEAQDQTGLSPLFASLAEARCAVARLLVSYGANIHIIDLVCYTPLHYAVGLGDVQLVKDLLEVGVEIDATDVDNWTPFYMAVIYEKYSILPLLISKGADVNIKDNMGSTPLMQVAYNNNVKMAGWLIKNVPNISF